MKKLCLLLIITHLCVSGFSQDMRCQIRNTYNKSVTMEQLAGARTLTDINSGFPSSWISSYSTVQISFRSGGSNIVTRSLSDTLTSEQLGLMSTSGEGTEIDFSVWYYTLVSPITKSELREIKFSYGIAPYVEASYPPGDEKLQLYVQESAIAKIATVSKETFPIAIVTFTVNEEGRVFNCKISQSSKSDNVDKILLHAVMEMPSWKPAQNEDGKKICQDLELHVGTFVGC